MNTHRIAVCIPTYNERENILAIAQAVREALPTADILVVDDNSPDGTADIVREFQKEHPWLKLHVRQEKKGLGAAYIDGFQRLIAAGYDIIIQMDADFSHQPKYLPHFIEEIDKGADVVIGSRYVKGGGTENWNLLRRIISRGGSLYSRIILCLNQHDVTAGYKCWRAETLKKVITGDLKLSGFGFQIEMSFRTKLVGAKIKEYPIVFPDREKGVSKMSGKIFKEALFGVWKLRLMGRRVFD